MLHLFTFDRVTIFFNTLPEVDRIKITKTIMALREGDFDSIHIKTIRRPIKELIVKNYRFLFCIESATIYFINAFTKKTLKTPRNEIETAEKTYSLLIEKSN